MQSNDSRQLTTKQAYWLKHLREYEASGQPLGTYAASHEFQPQHLYTWRSRLRALGVLQAPERARRKRAAKKPVLMRRQSRPAELGFIAARVATDNNPPLTTGIRIRFPNGVTLEVGSSVQAMPDARLLSLLAALP